MNLLQTLEAEQMKAVRAKAHPDFRAGDTLKVNDKVVTTGGIYGQVTRISGDTVQVQIADKVRIDISKAAVGGLQGQPQVQDAEGAQAKE